MIKLRTETGSVDVFDSVKLSDKDSMNEWVCES